MKKRFVVLSVAFRSSNRICSMVYTSICNDDGIICSAWKFVIRLRRFRADPYPWKGLTLREPENSLCAHSRLGIHSVSIWFAIFTDNTSKLTGKIYINLIHIILSIKINLEGYIEGYIINNLGLWWIYTFCIEKN